MPFDAWETWPFCTVHVTPQEQLTPTHHLRGGLSTAYCEGGLSPAQFDMQRKEEDKTQAEMEYLVIDVACGGW